MHLTMVVLLLVAGLAQAGMRRVSNQQDSLVSSGKCGQSCPYGNNDCPAASCSRCNGPGGFGGVCVKGYPCEHACKADTDCDQTSQCNQCWAGKCSSTCGPQSNCSTSHHCLSPGCNACIDHQCQMWSCGKNCNSNSDCMWGSCTECYQGVCGATCAGFCLQDSDCLGGGCTSCQDSKCIGSTTVAAEGGK